MNFRVPEFYTNSLLIKFWPTFPSISNFSQHGFALPLKLCLPTLRVAHQKILILNINSASLEDKK